MFPHSDLAGWAGPAARFHPGLYRTSGTLRVPHILAVVRRGARG